MRAPNKILPTQERLQTLFTYNPDEGTIIWKRRNLHEFHSQRTCNRFNTALAGKEAGTVYHAGHGVCYKCTKVDGQWYLVHRLIWKLVTGVDPIDKIDHEDLNGLNNRWSNLREATSSDSVCNRATRRDSSTGHKGVYKTRFGTFYAQISRNGYNRGLGSYKTIEEAIEAYKKAADELHGDFARY